MAEQQQQFKITVHIMGIRYSMVKNNIEMFSKLCIRPTLLLMEICFQLSYLKDADCEKYEVYSSKGIINNSLKWVFIYIFKRSCSNKKNKVGHKIN